MIAKRCFPKKFFIDPRSVVHAAAASMVEAVVSGQHHQHPYIHHPHTSQPIKSEPNETSDHGTQKPEEKEQKGK